MSHTRNLDYLIKRRIIYRRAPLNDQPTESFEWGDYYENGTHECYELFRSKAKITTFKSLKWHFLVLYYLNQDRGLLPSHVYEFIADKQNGFVTFFISDKRLQEMIDDVCNTGGEPPKNKPRKIIFKEFSGLTTEEKFKVVGQMVGRSKLVTESDIYQCMLDLHDEGRFITILGLARILDCSPRTIHRNMSMELKKEKELLNKEI